ncbi:MAG: excinuclease ABC subunit C [Bacteroidetes bacterium]|mgnify:CR=1 FL=1|nr:excinuclease ABC subunit C [Bacteroidota bacterium]
MSKQFVFIPHDYPTNPGIYKYFDSEGKILYVGKAKNLRKRIASYFAKTNVGYKTNELVRRIYRVECTIVDSEQDALLLENALIKEYQPKFNINLKDDKTYPFIVIKHEPFPRIFLTRKKLNDGSEYLGPFTSAGKVRELLHFIREFIPLRTCKLNLTEKNIRSQKFKVCLEYHLGNCKGPCEGLQSSEDYLEGLAQIRQMLKGNLKPVILRYKKEMATYAAKMDFEKAAVIKKKLNELESYQSKSVIVGKSFHNVDVFSFIREGDTAFINYLMIQNGAIIQTHAEKFVAKLDEPDAEILRLAIIDLRKTFNSQANEIVVPFNIDLKQDHVTITIPRGGEKKKLLELSFKNAHYFKEDQHRKKILNVQSQSVSKEITTLLELQKYLHLQEIPAHIECFDNSNFQGSFPVSAMVYFSNGIPDKKNYRHYHVKTVKGINDFATMKEVVFRRYKRLLDEKKPLPQLVIIDGGKGQLSAALESMKALGIENKITTIGLAKNIEEIFFAHDTASIKLPTDSAALNLVRFIRDEVHRFGITFHRNKRSKGFIKNELEDIKGIGKILAERLLKEFRSVKNLRSKSVDEIAAITGKAKAIILYNHLHKIKRGLDENPTPY